MILQSVGAGGDLILVELFLFVISCCAGYAAWRLRQIYSRVNNLVDDVEDHELVIFGKDGSGFEGVEEKSVKNEERTQENRKQIKVVSRVVSRVLRVLERRDYINTNDYPQVAPWQPDDFTRGGGDDGPRADGGQPNE
jgi:hypothetical protein